MFKKYTGFVAGNIVYNKNTYKIERVARVELDSNGRTRIVTGSGCYGKDPSDFISVALGVGTLFSEFEKQGKEIRKLHDLIDSIVDNTPSLEFEYRDESLPYATGTRKVKCGIKGKQVKGKR